MTSRINQWFFVHQRELPWRKTKDPYCIWLSEIILQQTRIVQGLPYYERFVNKYPRVFDLARASEEDVLKLWQGLGYYSRARNLHHTAQYVVRNYEGKFPETYQGLKKLKGIGDYTASAIASICYDEPVAVLDGNVFRVLSRFFGIDLPINSTEGRKIFKQTAQKFLDKEHPGNYNQAIMEFGALQCTPHNPDCSSCPLQVECVAFQQGKIRQLPVKLKKTKVRNRFFNYLIFLSLDGKSLLQQRTGQDIWKKLYEFPLVETSKSVSKTQLLSVEYLDQLNVESHKVRLLNEKPIKHQLSHQKLWVQFWLIPMEVLPTFRINEKTEKVKVEELESFPVPALIAKFLQKNDFYG